MSYTDDPIYEPQTLLEIKPSKPNRYRTKHRRRRRRPSFPAIPCFNITRGRRVFIPDNQIRLNLQ